MSRSGSVSVGFAASSTGDAAGISRSGFVPSGLAASSRSNASEVR